MEHADFQMIDPVELEHKIDDLFEREDQIVFTILSELVEIVRHIPEVVE